MAPYSLSSIIPVYGSPKITNWSEKTVFTKWGTCAYQGVWGLQLFTRMLQAPEMFCGFAKLPSTFHRREGEQIPTEFFIFLGQIFPLRLLNTVSQVHFTRFHKKKTQRRLWTNYSAELQFTAFLRAADEFKCFQLNQLSVRFLVPSEEPTDDRINKPERI